MPEKTKPGEKVDRKPQPEEDEKNLPEADKDNWSRDQLEKSYYYDDAHGYEIYNPDEDEEDD
jgi:hypothetical protein